MCECGCGNITRIAPRTNTRDGWIKGRPLRFINGHNVNSAILVRHNKENGAWNKGKTFGDDNRVPRPWLGKKRPDYRKKENEERHIGGQYMEWMFIIKNRDKWRCKINNTDCKGRLEAHHILDWVNYQELRYDINNGITLCQSHHPRGRDAEKRLADDFQRLVSASKVQTC